MQVRSSLVGAVVGATTYRRVICPDDRIPTDEPIDSQCATELEPALPAAAHGLDVDLVGEELPEHLTRLRDLPPKEPFHVADLVVKVRLDLLRVQVGNDQHAAEPSPLAGQSILAGLLGVEPHRDLVAR